MWLEATPTKAPSLAPENSVAHLCQGIVRRLTSARRCASAAGYPCLLAVHVCRVGQIVSRQRGGAGRLDFAPGRSSDNPTAGRGAPHRRPEQSRGAGGISEIRGPLNAAIPPTATSARDPKCPLNVDTSRPVAQRAVDPPRRLESTLSASFPVAPGADATRQRTAFPEQPARARLLG